MIDWLIAPLEQVDMGWADGVRDMHDGTDNRGRDGSDEQVRTHKAVRFVSLPRICCSMAASPLLLRTLVRVRVRGIALEAAR